MVDIRPQKGPQEQFLASGADIVIYGGAAGGGKTWALLIEPARHLANGEFGAVIFRRSYPEIMNEGGLWDESKRIYGLMGGVPTKGSLYWTFSSGARISFAHLQYDETLDDWKGAQIPLIEFDQLETFTEKQFFYMLSRNRSLCGIRPYIRGSCNPEPGWLANLLSWWIAEDGYADLARAGVVRWMARQVETIHWGDTRQELVELLGADTEPLSVTFLPATVYDNKALLARDPGYISKLKGLPLVDRERLLGDIKRGGNWKIKPAAGKVFNRAWFKIVDAVPADEMGYCVRRWDFAATERQLEKSDPDYTASCLMMRGKSGFYILDVTADQAGPADVERRFLGVSRGDAARYGAHGYAVRWEEEPGSAGKRESWRLMTLLAGMDAMGKSARGSKLVRAKPLAVQAEAGNVFLIRGVWNEMFLEHMHGQPDWPHDDMMDGASGAFEDVQSEVTYGPNLWE